MCKKYIVFSIMILAFALLFSPHIISKKLPDLYGKVLLRTSSGDIPLKQVEIWLFDVEKIKGENKARPGKLLHKRYSDFKGNYAFYKIENNRAYYLKVVIGRKGQKMIPDEVMIIRGNVKEKIIMIEIGAESTKIDIVVEL
jgi:hypothetical protein